VISKKNKQQNTGNPGMGIGGKKIQLIVCGTDGAPYTRNWKKEWKDYKRMNDGEISLSTH